jgi:hypothetical protein
MDEDLMEKLLDNPSLEVQLEAINRDPTFLQVIPNPSYQTQLTAVRKNGLMIQGIPNPCLELQMEAVKQNSRAIQYINNPVLEVQLETVRHDGIAIMLIKDPCLEVAITAVNNYMCALLYVNDIKILDYIDCFQTHNQETLLFYTVNKDMIMKLLRMGVDPNIENSFGCTAKFYSHTVEEILDSIPKLKLICLLLRKCKWYRLAKLVRSRIFCEWYYSPENTGGKRARKMIRDMVK